MSEFLCTYHAGKASAIWSIINLLVRYNVPNVIICIVNPSKKGFKRKKGQIVLDQIRTIDKKRLIKKLGSIDAKTQLEVISVLQRLFAF